MEASGPSWGRRAPGGERESLVGGKETINRSEFMHKHLKNLLLTCGEKVALAPLQLAQGLRAVPEACRARGPGESDAG